MKELATRIYTFLEKYAKLRPDFDQEFDDDNEKYTSPLFKIHTNLYIKFVKLQNIKL